MSPAAAIAAIARCLASAVGSLLPHGRPPTDDQLAATLVQDIRFLEGAVARKRALLEDVRERRLAAAASAARSLSEEVSRLSAELDALRSEP